MSQQDSYTECWEDALQINKCEILLFPKQSSFIALLNLQTGIINKKYLKYPSDLKFKHLSIAYRQKRKEIFMLQMSITSDVAIYMMKLQTLTWKIVHRKQSQGPGIISISNIFIKNDECYMIEKCGEIYLHSFNEEGYSRFEFIKRIDPYGKVYTSGPSHSTTIFSVNYAGGKVLILDIWTNGKIHPLRFSKSNNCIITKSFDDASKKLVNAVDNVVILRDDIILCFIKPTKYNEPTISIINLSKSSITKSYITSPEAVKVILIENEVEEELTVFGYCRKYSIHTLPITLIKIICNQYQNDNLLFIRNTNEKQIHYTIIKVDDVLIEEEQHKLYWLPFNKLTS